MEKVGEQVFPKEQQLEKVGEQVFPKETSAVKAAPSESVAAAATKKEDLSRMTVSLKDSRISCPKKEATTTIGKALENIVYPLKDCRVTFSVVSQVPGVQEHVVRRELDEFYNLHEALEAECPHALLPISPRHHEFDILAGLVTDMATPGVVETRRRKMEEFLRRCIAHPDVRESLVLHDFLVHQGRHDTVDDVEQRGPSALEVAKLQAEKATGMISSLPERRMEDLAWAATDRYFVGLKQHIERVVQPLRKAATLQLELSEHLRDAALGMHDLAVYEDEIDTPRDEIRAIRTTSAALGSAALLTRHKAEEVDAMLADALDIYAHYHHAFKVAETKRQALLLKVEEAAMPLEKEKKHVVDVCGPEPTPSLIEGLTDRAAALLLHDQAVEDRKNVRCERAVDKLHQLEEKEDEAMREYDALSDRLRQELKRLHIAKSEHFRALFTDYIDHKRRISDKELKLWQ